MAGPVLTRELSKHEDQDLLRIVRVRAARTPSGYGGR